MYKEKKENKLCINLKPLREYTHTHTHTHTSRNLKEEKRVVKGYSKNIGNRLLIKHLINVLSRAYFFMHFRFWHEKGEVKEVVI